MTAPIEATKTAIDSYAEYALKHQVLTDEEEAWTGKWILEGYKWAQDYMVINNLKFVVKIAGSLKMYGASVEDKIQDGNLGLINAARKFDYRRGFRFNSYAIYWIKSEIQRKWERYESVVSMPSNSKTSKKEARKIMNDYYNEHGHDMGVVQFMEAAKITETMAIAMLAGKQKDLSLDTPQYDSDDRTGMEMLCGVSDDARVTEGRALSAVVIDRATRDKDSRGADILRMRYGLYPYSGQSTLSEVGIKYGISREMARQAQEAELAEIRRAAKRAKLKVESREIMYEARRAGLVSPARRGIA